MAETVVAPEPLTATTNHLYVQRSPMSQVGV
jgi:hypothetical protein